MKIKKKAKKRETAQEIYYRGYQYGVEEGKKLLRQEIKDLLEIKDNNCPCC